VAPVNVQLKPQQQQRTQGTRPGEAPPRITQQPLETEFEIQTYVARAANAGAAAPETNR
jgi:hypothetical protein